MKVFGRTIQRLKTSIIDNPREKWMRCEGTFEPIVSREAFEAAARVRSFDEKVSFTSSEMLQMLGKALKKRGKLTTEIIDSDCGLSSTTAMRSCFGTLTAAYEMLAMPCHLDLRITMSSGLCDA